MGHSGVLFVCLFVWLCWIFFAAQAFSLVAASGGQSPVGVRGFLIAVASLVAEPRL